MVDIISKDHIPTMRQKDKKVFNYQYTSIDPDNGLVSIRRQAIIWNNDVLVYWRIYASFGLNILEV